MSTQIEVKEPIKLLNKDGSLTQPGWAKRNIIEYNREDIRASKWTVKEWDFYQVGCKDFIVQFNFFNISLASAATIGYVNLKTGEVVNDMILDLATANKFPVNRNGEEPYTFERKKGKKVLRFEVTKEKRHLYWKSPKIECDFWADNYTGERIVIMNPFEKHANHFFFTEKINCMPPRGFVKIGSEVIDGNRDDLFTVLDWGRGVWTYHNTWDWSSASGLLDGAPFGWNLGYGFGDTSAATENALIYNGRLHKLDHVTFEIPMKDGKEDYLSPWRFTSSDGRFEMQFRPVLDRAACTDFKLLKSDQHQVFGTFTGTAVLDDGSVLSVRDFFGFAEKVENKW